MSFTQVPHFDLPFRLTSGGAAVVEQDSIDDVANCVTAIVATEVGFRDEAPTFGIEDMTFTKQPIDVQDLQAEIGTQEPRALLIIEEHPDMRDELIARVNIGVSTVRANS